jgi:hypothetical protein
MTDLITPATSVSSSGVSESTALNASSRQPGGALSRPASQRR